MQYSTTEKIHGREISEHKGVVTGEFVTGVSFIKDFFAGFSNTFGGSSDTYGKEIEKTKNEALRELTSKAENAGANAIVGLRIDISTVALGKSSLFVCNATGTAVVVDEA